jgi:N-glycosylase/DNA lyase
LTSDSNVIHATTVEPQTDWHWLKQYLQVEIDYATILAQLPDDLPLRAAVTAHRGLRLLRQPVWECLASFILSSTKQIVQIRQIIEALARTLGTPVASPPGARRYSFPVPEQVARAAESTLRSCKMGFRAPYLLAAARAVADGKLDLSRLESLPTAEARAQLMSLAGVGDKIADCVLLFSCGHADAFPIDVWVARALRRHYFRGRNVPLLRLREFAARRWSGCGGYAQQYLFHHARQESANTARPRPTRRR